MQVAEQLNTALAGHYRIAREIDRGRMAIVYEAHDLRHDRLVALKVLNPDLGAVLGATRFLEEIRLTAHLQHPNLLPLFDSGEADGLLFYVMPYIEGESLRRRLSREVQLPIDEAVHIAASVAGALDYAHANGVVHRDLKPENILLQRGQPIVADFGIALAVRRAGGQRITQTGVSLGTPYYMSPEQATGERVIDARSDIYSLAAVLYEMLTGEPPHTGHTVQGIIAKVITEHVPSVRVTRPNVPDHVASAIARGLEKVAADRWATAADFADALTGGKRVAANQVPSLFSSPKSVARPRAVLTGVIGLLFGIFLAIVAISLWSPATSLTWYDLVIPDSAAPALMSPNVGLGIGRAVDLSPDGRAVVYVTGWHTPLAVRRFDELAPRLLAGTERASCPSFSPDGRWIVYSAREQLFKVSVDGGPPIVLSDSASNCGVWTDRDEVVFDRDDDLYRVPAGGGAVTVLARRDSNRLKLMLPTRALPGGRAVLINLSPTANANDYQLGIVSLPDGKVTRLTEPGSDGEARFGATYSRGRLFFHHGKAVVSAPFSLRSELITGPEVTILQDTVYNFVTSASANAVYTSVPTRTLNLVAVSLNGAARILSGRVDPSESNSLAPIDTAHYAWPRLSPDGKRVALELRTSTHTWDVSIYDFASHSLSRLTRDFTGIRPERWTSDGEQLLYFRLDTPNIVAPRHLVAQPWDGSAPAKELFHIPATTHDITLGPPHTYAVVALTSPPPHTGLVLVPLDTPNAARPLRPAQQREGEPRISPDGRLLAYVGNETRRFEVYVRPLLAGNRIQVSTTGGTEPVWSPDGRSLFYRGTGTGYVMRVTLATHPALRVTQRESLFKDVYELRDAQNYDVFPEGKELLMIRASPIHTHLMVVQNWPELLRQRSGVH